MRPVELAVLEQVLIYHQRLDIGHCACGWGVDSGALGKSHARHIIEVFEAAAEYELR